MRHLLLIPLLALMLISCTEQNHDVQSTFSIDKSAIEVSDTGGYYEIAYNLEEQTAINPIAVTDVEWITDIDNSTAGVITFRVLPNDSGAERDAVLTFRHITTPHTPQCHISQRAAEGEHLTLEVTKLDYSECEVNITPINEDIKYVVMMAEREYFTKLNISSAEELIASDISFFNQYLNGGESLEEFLSRSGLAMQGASHRAWQDLSPAREYVIYAYGIYLCGDTYECITNVVYTLIEDRLPERVAEDFDIEIKAEGPEVTFCVSPKSWEGYYAVQIIEDSEAGYVEQGLPITETTEDAIAEAFFYIADHLYYFEEQSADEIMQQLGYKGDTEFSKTLNANHRYMALTYAIESDSGNVPMVVSKPIVSYFSTGTVERSDMTFEASFENIRPRSVDVTITPSSNETYSAVLMYAKSLPTGDKQEQLEWVMSKYAPLELSGVYSEHITQLPPATEFILAVYGYYAGAATTDLFLYRFSTTEDGEGINRITEVRTTAYDLAEVVALEPYYASFVGYADLFISIEVATAMPAPALHFDIFRSDVVEEYTPEEIRESLLEYSYTSTPDWALCSYGNEYVVCGLAEDENGYVGEMFISEPIRFERSDVGDASDFVELYKDYVTRNGLRQSNF